MVFRKDNKVESFQRQISALRQQLGNEEETDEEQSASQQRGYEGDQDESPAGAYGFSDVAASLPSPPQSFAPEQPTPPEAPSIPSLTGESTVVANDTTWK